MIKTNKEYNISIKSKIGSDPSIINTTRRSKFKKNKELKNLVDSFDELIKQYLDDPYNKDQKHSEVDRDLNCYKLICHQNNLKVFN